MDIGRRKLWRGAGVIACGVSLAALAAAEPAGLVGSRADDAFENTPYSGPFFVCAPTSQPRSSVVAWMQGGYLVLAATRELTPLPGWLKSTSGLGEWRVPAGAGTTLPSRGVPHLLRLPHITLYCTPTHVD